MQIVMSQINDIDVAGFEKETVTISGVEYYRLLKVSGTSEWSAKVSSSSEADEENWNFVLQKVENQEKKLELRDTECRNGSKNEKAIRREQPKKSIANRAEKSLKKWLVRLTSSSDNGNQDNWSDAERLNQIGLEDNIIRRNNGKSKVQETAKQIRGIEIDTVEMGLSVEDFLGNRIDMRTNEVQRNLTGKA